MDDAPPDLVAATALTRRRFLGASGLGAVAAALGCDGPPPERIVPFVRRPPEQTPGESRWYATAAERKGLAVGLLVESRDGRPIKVEPHPTHPGSLGGAGAREQAALYDLYDVDRGRRVTVRGRAATWRDLHGRLRARLAPRRGEGLHVVLEPTSSPLVSDHLARLRAAWPGARVWFDPTRAPVARWAATRRLLGRPLDLRHDLGAADRVLTVDADALDDGPDALANAARFGARRGLGARGLRAPLRLVAFESAPTPTGMAADHRFAVRPGAMGDLLRALLARVGGGDGAGGAAAGLGAATLDALAADLAAHAGRVAVIVGDRQPWPVHALGLALSDALGSLGAVTRAAPSPLIEAGGEPYDLGLLERALDDGAVGTLVALGVVPGALARLEGSSARAGFVLAQASHERAWRGRADAIVPLAHFLESWGDLRAPDGTVTPVQPLIRPLFGGRSAPELLAWLAGETRLPARVALARAWEAAGWDLEAALARGLVPGTAVAPVDATPHPDAVRAALRAVERDAAGLTVELREDPRLADGRQANNPWLQELPEPASKLTWGNAALLAPATAARLGVERGDVLALVGRGGRVELPAFPLEGVAAGTLVVWAGHGLDHGRVARGHGADVRPLRGGSPTWRLTGVRVERTGRREALACTQPHRELGESGAVVRLEPEALAAHPELLRHRREAPPSLYPERLEGSPQWGMVIDLDRCTGCSACVVACQAENDVPVVGPDQVRLGREMHWLRIDVYDVATGDDHLIVPQPMLCQHCEHAPCEYVCPVAATVHSPDGLNEMVYNRCVGTRFCSNNCPYKVRRFNFFDYNRDLTEAEKLAKNPDVTVRARGVMEKCTYCVQRIRRAGIEAKLERRPLREGDVVTACQQTCPTGAIVFGDLTDPRSAVVAARGGPREYAVLGHLNTRPRTRYLARAPNLLPAWTSAGAADGGSDGRSR